MFKKNYNPKNNTKLSSSSSSSKSLTPNISHSLSSLFERLHTRLFGLALIGCTFLFSAHGQLSALTYSLTNTYSSGASPEGSYTISFTDNVNTNKVDVTMTASGGAGVTEKVGAWYFNFAKDLTTNPLTFTYLSGTKADKISAGTNAFKAGPDGDYDIKVGFFTSNSKAFKTGQSSVYTISSVGNIDPEDFFNALTSTGTYNTAAHVQSIGSQDSSAWISNKNGQTPVPEPSTYLILGSMLGLVMYLRHRKIAKAKSRIK